MNACPDARLDSERCALGSKRLSGRRTYAPVSGVDASDVRGMGADEGAYAP